MPSSRVYFSVTTTQIKTGNDSIFRNVPLLSQHFAHLVLALLFSLCSWDHVPRSPLRLASFASWDSSTQVPAPVVGPFPRLSHTSLYGHHLGC